MCRHCFFSLYAILLGLLLTAGHQTSAYALPPQVIADGELVIIERDAASDEPADAEPAEPPVGKEDDVDRFLPTKKLEPLLVHPHYYTRDLQFQAKSIERGPYLLVANHPRTGCRCTANIVLPDGSPIVVHEKNAITYVYPSQRVIVDFGFFGDSDPRVLYREGQGTFRTVHEKLAGATRATREFIGKFPLAGALSERGRKTADTAKGAVATASGLGKAYVETVGRLIDGLPGVRPLQSIGERLPELGQQEKIRRAGERAARNATEFIPTVR